LDRWIVGPLEVVVESPYGLMTVPSLRLVVPHE